MATDNRIRKIVRPLILLAIFAAAWTGKTFDLHTPEFYRAQRIETLADAGREGAAREQVCTYCPICHFEFYYFEQASAPLCITPDTLLLGDAPLCPPCRIAAACLAEGLSFQPGVRVEDDCQNCGFAQVRINGLDGHYSQILVDSHPIFSSLTGVYGLEQIPASMIERVEVLRGGGSALFGSSAIGGTINIITRDPLRNSGEFSHTLSAIGCSSSYDNNTTLNASLDRKSVV